MEARRMRTNGNHKSTIRSAKKKKTPKRNDVLEREKKRKAINMGSEKTKRRGETENPHIYRYTYIYPHEEISWLARVYRNYSPYVRRLFQRNKELR